MIRQHKADATIRSYIAWIKRYISAIYKFPNTLPSEQKVERFLTELAHNNACAATQNQAFNAILFFYEQVMGISLQKIDAFRASRPAHIRSAPSEEEVHIILSSVTDEGGYPSNLIANLIYGCGLRISESVSIRIKDIRLDDSAIIIREPKFGHDRMVSIPCSLSDRIKSQMQFAKVVWDRDVRLKIPIQLPHQLARKYPEFEFSFQWAWFTPLRNPCADPGDPSRLVRWHMLTDTVQRAIKRARRETGIMVVPHELRHAYATHCLKRGSNIKAIQLAMGHKQIQTTAGYCHAEALSVKSPLD